MKKTILTIGAIVIFNTVSSAQTKNDTIQNLQQQIVNLEYRNNRLSKQVSSVNLNIRKLEGRLLATVDSVEILKKEMINTNNDLQAMAAKFDLQMSHLGDKSKSDIEALNNKMSTNNLYLILAIISFALFAVILSGWLRSRLMFVKTELSVQIKKSSEAIMEEIIKLDNQVFWSLDFQKILTKAEATESENPDHSLISKVADEIVRIRKNISNMDQDTKGLKQLEYAVDRIQDNFKDNGYEIIDLLNKPYYQGMKVSAKFKTDNRFKRGEQIITRIIKPQINYNNVIIQEAQVEVSVGEQTFISPP